MALPPGISTAAASGARLYRALVQLSHAIGKADCRSRPFATACATRATQVPAELSSRPRPVLLGVGPRRSGYRICIPARLLIVSNAMDFIALIAAAIGLALLYLVFVLANKISNRWARYLALIVGILLAFSIAGNVPLLLGEPDFAMSTRTGQYMFTIGVPIAIVSMILKRKRSKQA